MPGQACRRACASHRTRDRFTSRCRPARNAEAARWLRAVATSSSADRLLDRLLGREHCPRATRGTTGSLRPDVARAASGDEICDTPKRRSPRDLVIRACPSREGVRRWPRPRLSRRRRSDFGSSKSDRHRARPAFQPNHHPRHSVAGTARAPTRFSHAFPPPVHITPRSADRQVARWSRLEASRRHCLLDCPTPRSRARRHQPHSPNHRLHHRGTAFPSRFPRVEVSSGRRCSSTSPASLLDPTMCASVPA